ncbi:MAG TPA: hypothetical protein VIO38_15460 [Rariglobus sp.]
MLSTSNLTTAAAAPTPQEKRPIDTVSDVLKEAAEAFGKLQRGILEMSLSHSAAPSVAQPPPDSIAVASSCAVPPAVEAPEQRKAAERAPDAEFVSSSQYRTLPRPLVKADGCTGCEWTSYDSGHLTVSGLVAVLKTLPDTVQVTTGAEVAAKVLSVHALEHRDVTHLEMARDGRKHCSIEAIVTSLGPDDNRFNAVQLDGMQIDVLDLIEQLEPYAADSPDAIVIVPSGLASILKCPRTTPAISGTLAVVVSRPFWQFSECNLDPFAPDGRNCAALDKIVARAKGMLAVRSSLSEIATYIGRALANGGLAAVDLFYVPGPLTRAAAIVEGPRRGSLLTLAEFTAAHGGRTINEKQIERFYRPVVPSDLSAPVSSLARILSTGCDNVADVYALLNDPTFDL